MKDNTSISREVETHKKVGGTYVQPRRCFGSVPIECMIPHFFYCSRRIACSHPDVGLKITYLRVHASALLLLVLFTLACRFSNALSIAGVRAGFGVGIRALSPALPVPEK